MAVSLNEHFPRQDLLDLASPVSTDSTGVQPAAGLPKP